MATAANTPALLALFIGIYFLAAALGGLTHPGRWERMEDEIEKSAFSQFVGGVLAMIIGFVLIALVPPSGDWLNWVLFVIGMFALVQGVAFLTVPGRVLPAFRPFLQRASRPYALFTTLLGLGFCLLGLSRLDFF